MNEMPKPVERDDVQRLMAEESARLVEVPPSEHIVGVTIEDVRSIATGLPRTTEALVRGRLKFRVGRIVYLAFSRDETKLGFAFPKEFREALVESEPDKFLMPRPSDLRYNWAVVRLASIDEIEMQELVVDAWAMVVPKSVAAAYAHALSEIT
jgi:hypothetical protein